MLTEISDAIWQYVFPHLDLQDIMQLASTCTAFQHLIAHTPLDHLSAAVRQTVLPSELTSDQSLLELVSQQGEFLTRLRGRGSFSPRIQHLSFNDDVLGGNAHHAPSQNGPLFQFEQLLWSPSTKFEDPSRWLLLNPESGGERAPIVLDTKTGEQVSFHERRCPFGLDPPLPGHVPELHASWLSDGHCLLLHPAQEDWWHGYAYSPKGTRLVDACSQSMTPVILPGVQHAGNSHFFTARSLDDHERDLLAWVASPVVNRRLEDHIIVFEVIGWRTLFQLACPEDALHMFLQRSGLQISPGRQGERQNVGINWDITAHDLKLSPNKRLLAVTWLCQRREGQAREDSKSMLMGLSIHDAVSGACQHSMVLTPEGPGPTHQPEWLPRSSNLMYANSNGLHLITSAGQLLWRTPLPEIHLRLLTSMAWQPDARSLTITPSASPCGRWVLVTEEYYRAQHAVYRSHFHHEPAGSEDQEPTFKGRISIVEASTGSILASQMTHHPCVGHIEWSVSGDTCLHGGLPGVCCIIAPNLQAVPQTNSLDARPPPEHTVKPRTIVLTVQGKLRSLSPCGTIIAGLKMSKDASLAALLHWQPHPAAVVTMKLTGPDRVKMADHSPLVIQKCLEAAAWHPLQSACLYAVGSNSGGVFVIDAKANRCVVSWDEDELHGHPTAFHQRPYSRPDSCAADDLHTEGGWDMDPTAIQHKLEWSKDGRRLAVASGASSSTRARCSILHFGDSFSRTFAP